jgi:hypothetical protein
MTRRASKEMSAMAPRELLRVLTAMARIATDVNRERGLKFPTKKGPRGLKRATRKRRRALHARTLQRNTWRSHFEAIKREAS